MPYPAAESAIVRGFAPLAGWTKECHLNPISGQHAADRAIISIRIWGWEIREIPRHTVSPDGREDHFGGCVKLNNIQMQLQLDLKFGAGFGVD